MPYELSFAKSIGTFDRANYINDCCVGGDLVAEVLLPSLNSRYGDLGPIEEDWGWFIWFENGGSKLAVDIFCDDSDKGEFRIHITSRVRGFFGSKVHDTPELEILKLLVVDSISVWTGHLPLITRLDEKHLPVGSAN